MTWHDVWSLLRNVSHDAPCQEEDVDGPDDGQSEAANGGKKSRL